MSDDERYEPVPLGFGIEAAPPSYKAAISKKNESIFKVHVMNMTICEGLINGEEDMYMKYSIRCAM